MSSTEIILNKDDLPPPAHMTTTVTPHDQEGGFKMDYFCIIIGAATLAINLTRIVLWLDGAK